MMIRRSIPPAVGAAAVLLAAIATGAPLAAQSSATQTPPAPAPAAPQAAALRWFKGNTHTHTWNSDGDSSPDDVVKWYRGHGYHFLVLTDHNVLTSIEGLNALHGLDQRFVVIRGEEVTDRFGDLPLHINALGLDTLVMPQGGTSVVDVLQRNVTAIRAARGVPHINHPNFIWAITAEQLEQVRDNRLFEIFNGHPQVNNLGGGAAAGLEGAWDAILTRGVLLYGLAVDDAHHFTRHDDRTAARPGKGWVMVRAASLEPRAILDALERGEFYSSTGVELREYVADARTMRVAVRATTFSRYRIRFIGSGGRVLSEVDGPTATYTFRGDEGYVRAKVFESNGDVAWTQPVIIRR